MSIIKAGKIQTGISVTPANNFILDAIANNGSMALKRASGETILSVSASGLVDIAGSGKIFGRSNILGTVSQSGGVPTGTIIENGSNANGRYTKFADGTLFCHVRTPTINWTAPIAGSWTWTYPHSFVYTPLCIAALKTVEPQHYHCGAYGDGLTASGIFMGGLVYSSGGVADCFAIGRWY